MAQPATSDEFLDLVRKSGVVDEQRLAARMGQLRAGSALPQEPGRLAGVLVRDGILTHFQAEQFLLGKWRRFTIGKYKVLERLGSGGMGSVYLCEHLFMHRRVAVKVLPAAKAEDPSSLERFYREARAAGALDHPNIAHAYDIDQDENLHFLVMEYVDGSSLQEIVKKHGPLDILRASHYIRQSAVGLEHAHEADLVHRDIKPGNVMVDREGTAKVLDMGLARFFHDEGDVLTKKYDETVLGTADYLAPEQALDSHGVDIRADIYSLGATFYFILTGGPPFSEGSVAQKLIWHQTRQPKPVRAVRPEVPEGLAAIIEKMMAKDAAQRYQTPGEVVEALTPWTKTPIPPPPEAEMPRLSPAAMGAGLSDAAVTTPAPGSTGFPSPLPRKLTPAPSPRAFADSAMVLRPKAQVAVATTPPPPARPPVKPPSSSALPKPPVPATGDNGLVTPPPRAESPPAEAAPPNWELLASESDDSVVKDRAGPAVASVPPRLGRGSKSSPERRRLWLVVAAVSVVFLIVLGALIVWSLPGGESKRITDPPKPSTRLTVTQAGTGDARTIREALAKAKPGSHIVVQDPNIEELLILLDGKQGKDVFIEGDPSLGKPVTWRPPAQLKPDEKQLLVVSGIEGLRLKGFILDGQDKMDDLVTLFGKCPGLKLEDVQLQGFKRSAVHVKSCAGENSKPVTLARLRTTTTKEAEAALIFEAPTSQVNQHVHVHDCRFEGPYKTAVLLAGPVADVEFRRNRFFKAGDGFFYRIKNAEGVPLIPRPRLHLTLDANTFCDIARVGLHLEGLPLSDKNNQVSVTNNLFARTTTLAHVDDYAPMQPRQPSISAQWIWFNEGDPLKSAAPGSRFFRKVIDLPPEPVAQALLEITCDDGFTVWLNGAPVGQGLFAPRIYAFDVKKLLVPGKNVLAVQAANKVMRSAGLLAQLTYVPAGAAKPTFVVSDSSWKASKDGSQEGWQKADFDDSGWPVAKVLVPYNGKDALPGWQNLFWESVIPEQLKEYAKPIFSTITGTVRDPASKEGNLLLDAKEIPFVLSADPANDAEFLRYPKTSPLSRACRENKPVGVPPAE